MTDRSSSTVSTTDAIDAMRQRGIDDPESLVSCTTADRIVKTCLWYDGLSGVTKGLLVKRIREGGVEDTPAKATPRDRFTQLVQHYSEGSVTESHKRLQRRRDYDEDCDGLLIVIEEPTFPSLVARCDNCGHETAYPFKALAAGVLPDRPPADPRPVPDAQPQVPEGARRPAVSYPSVRGVHPVRFDDPSLRWRHR